MAIPTYNPYKTGLFTDGLDYIIANIPGSPTFADISDTAIDYFAALPDPPSANALAEMAIANANSANDYMNQKIAQNLNFDANAIAFIDSLLSGLQDNTIDSLTDFLQASQEQLAAADINTISKTSLYIALTVAQGSVLYWNNIVTTPGSWATYLNAEAAINYANIPAWTAAAFVGSLSGFAQVQEPYMQGAGWLNLEGRAIGSSVAFSTALAVTAGKVILKWAKRPVVGVIQDCFCQ